MAMFCIHCRSEIDPKFKACPFCGEAITDFLRRYANEPIDGKYQLISRLGVGGMGEVYKALHIHLNSIRVIKVMRPQISNEEEAHDRFLREARLATRIQHQNVATLFDFSTLDDGSRYMVWEYIEGINLHELIQSRGPLSPRYAADVAIEALHGLEAIHRAGIVHRDISPENLMVSRGDEGQERVKIIDLGIAKAGIDGDDKTKTGMFVGKWKYCSPEHLGLLTEGERIDGRADLYSFGIVLYEMLTGVPPFQADTPHSYLMMHSSERPKALRDVNPSMTSAPQLEALMFRALEKDRKNRFASAREFATAIEQIKSTLSAESSTATTVALGTAAPTQIMTSDGSAPTLITAVVDAPVPVRKRRIGMIAAVAAAAAAAAAIVPGMMRTPATVPQSKPVVRASIVQPPPAIIPKTESAGALSSSVSVVAEKRGHLGVNAFPWAEVTKIRNVESGDDVELRAPLVTPAPIDLPAGRYEITFSNPAFGKSIRKTVNIAAGQEQLITVTFADATSAALPSLSEDIQ